MSRLYMIHNMIYSIYETGAAGVPEMALVT